MSSDKASASSLTLDRIVAQARRDAEQRDKGYRERALKMYPWICGRCAREFTRSNLSELTVRPTHPGHRGTGIGIEGDGPHLQRHLRLQRLRQPPDQLAQDGRPGGPATRPRH